ncbi:MAG: glycine cleavage T C-terminal barrel domain-containing protein, partial [Burkholderiales bacterium]
TVWPVRVRDQPVGQITSAVYSPRLTKNIGYAMLPIEHAALGTRISVDTPDGERNAIVVTMPFIDPTKALAKA